MYVTYDYKCVECGRIEERMVRREKRDHQVHSHPIGVGLDLFYMKRQLAAPRTTFRFADTRLKT